MERPPENNENIVIQESRYLPENPKNLTYRGRYNFQDKEVLKLAGIAELPPGSDISVLDFAGGVMEFGSPTAHDLIDSVEATGHSAHVIVVDKNIPAKLQPSYEEVSYHSSLDEIGSDQFDIVRVMHLVEHISQEEYQAIRQELAKRVKEGGLFIASQQTYFVKPASDYLSLLPPVVKVMQKREGTLVPIALLDDSYIPRELHDTDSESYERLRQEVARGEKSMADHPKKGLSSTVKVLSMDIEAALAALDNETSVINTRREIETKGDQFSYRYPYEGDILATLANNAESTAEYFSHRRSEQSQKVGSKVVQMLFGGAAKRFKKGGSSKN